MFICMHKCDTVATSTVDLR